MSNLYFKHWFDQSVIKLETAQLLYKNLRHKLYTFGKEPIPHDLVVINQCLIMIRSTIDYAIRGVSEKYGGKDRITIRNHQDKDKFMKELKSKTKCKNEYILNEFWNLRDSEHEYYKWYYPLNKMCNDDKHNYINKGKHYEVHKFQKNVLGINHSTTINIDNSLSPEMKKFAQKRYGLEDNENRNNHLHFDIDGLEVFEALNYYLEETNEFIINIYEELEGESWPPDDENGIMIKI